MTCDFFLPAFSSRSTRSSNLRASSKGQALAAIAMSRRDVMMSPEKSCLDCQRRNQAKRASERRQRCGIVIAMDSLTQHNELTMPALATGFRRAVVAHADGSVTEPTPEMTLQAAVT